VVAGVGGGYYFCAICSVSDDLGSISIDGSVGVVVVGEGVDIREDGADGDVSLDI